MMVRNSQREQFFFENLYGGGGRISRSAGIDRQRTGVALGKVGMGGALGKKLQAEKKVRSSRRREPFK